MSTSILLGKLDEAIRAAGDFDVAELLGSYVEFLLAVPVKKSRRIEKAKDFACPPENQIGLENLEKAIVNGDDLLPWMSKQYRNGHYFGDDNMMHLYGVTHFHLGTSADNKEPQKIERTSNLLYAYVKEDVIYELKVCGHGEWYSHNWQEILMNNWPEEFKKYKLGTDILDVAGVPETDKEIKKLTKLGIGTLIHTSEGTCFPIGCGVTTARTSVRAMLIADSFRHALCDYEQQFVKRYGYIHLKEYNIELDGRCIKMSSCFARRMRIDILTHEVVFY